MTKIDERTIQELSKAADLPMTADRVRLLTAQMNALLSAANELSEAMAQPSWMGVVPLVGFNHRSAPERPA